MKDRSPDPYLILASRSPRRRYLLEQAGLTFSVIPSAFDEASVDTEHPEEHVLAQAQGKAADVADRYPDSWVIGADTIVLIDGAILGKPTDMDGARAMLGRLSGQTHQVHTGYCIVHGKKNRNLSGAVETDVLFKRLSRAEIEWYVHTDEPFDKAGAYAVQGLGTFLVRSIRGSYTNVVGLPVCEVIEALIAEGALGLGEKDSAEPWRMGGTQR